jgi:hypothetical protein
MYINNTKILMSHLMYMYTTVLYKCMKLVDIDSHNLSYNMHAKN